MLTDIYRSLLHGPIPDSTIKYHDHFQINFRKNLTIRSSITYADEKTQLRIPRHKKKPAVATSIIIEPKSSPFDSNANWPLHTSTSVYKISGSNVQV